MKATIVAAKVFQPKPGKKRGTVVTPDEVLYGAMPPILSRVQVGGTYDIEYKEDHFNGKTYLVIEGVWPVAGAAPPAPAAAPSHTQPKYGNQTDETAERIYAAGIVNNSLANPNVNPFELSARDIAEQTQKARDAWRLTFGAKEPVATRAKVESGNDMHDDAIPF